MPTLREKAGALLHMAQSIVAENYFNDVTADEQMILEEVVRAVRAAGNLLMLHVKVAEQPSAVVEPASKKRKLRVVK